MLADDVRLHIYTHAQALMEHQTLPVHLSLPLLKHLLGTPMTFSDLEIVDPELHR